MLSLDSNLVPIVYRIRVISPDEESAIIFETTQTMMPTDVDKVRVALTEAYFHGAVVEINPA